MARQTTRTLLALATLVTAAAGYACGSADTSTPPMGGGTSNTPSTPGGSASPGTPSSGGSTPPSSGTGSIPADAGATPSSGGVDAGETFSDLYATVLGPTAPYNCATHHSASGADSFLDLGDASAAYASLVNAPAAGPKCGNGGTADMRVTPGSAANSLLWLKVWTLADGGNEVPCGTQMPKNPDGGKESAHPLAPADEAKVKSWIANGAKND